MGEGINGEVKCVSVGIDMGEGRGAGIGKQVGVGIKVGQGCRCRNSRDMNRSGCRNKGKT